MKMEGNSNFQFWKKIEWKEIATPYKMGTKIRISMQEKPVKKGHFPPLVTRNKNLMVARNQFRHIFVNTMIIWGWRRCHFFFRTIDFSNAQFERKNRNWILIFVCQWFHEFFVRLASNKYETVFEFLYSSDLTSFFS